MDFWFHMLFDNDLHNDTANEIPLDSFRVDVAHEEVQNWRTRNWLKCQKAREIMMKYDNDYKTDPRSATKLLSWDSAHPNPDPAAHGEIQYVQDGHEPIEPKWDENLQPKSQQDRLYGRVSHEIDIWWERMRDVNYTGWVVPMETVEGAISRAQACKDNAMERFIPPVEGDPDQVYDHTQYGEETDDDRHEDAVDEAAQPVEGEEVDGAAEEEEEEDDDSYVEGPLRGILTEIPNILDTKQIEALHMTVRACIAPLGGRYTTVYGEELQQTRCKMFLALDCGKNLLREMLVFIAVWEQSEDQFIFQITSHIIEAIHDCALLPYAWDTLRILKDIVSPAQTILLRLISYMFRTRQDKGFYDDPAKLTADTQLVHFLYNFFRTRVVPDCIALIYAQSQVRNNHCHPSEFPVDLWDMERAKDGLAQYLDLISAIAEIPEMKPKLIEWEAVYELIAMLKALEAGVARKTLTEAAPPATVKTTKNGSTSSQSGTTTPNVERPYDPNPAWTRETWGRDNEAPAPGLPPLHDTPHKFPWTNIKNQIVTILTTLVSPASGRGPGEPVVQRQIVKHDGIITLLNCFVYDGNNEYLKERATLALKWVMEGCDEAKQFVENLRPLKNQQARANGANGAQGEASTRSTPPPSPAPARFETTVPLSPRSDAVYQDFRRLAEQSRQMHLGQ